MKSEDAIDISAELGVAGRRRMYSVTIFSTRKTAYGTSRGRISSLFSSFRDRRSASCAISRTAIKTVPFVRTSAVYQISAPAAMPLI